MDSLRLLPPVASVLLAGSLCAQFGEITATTAMPVGVVGVGLQHNGAGALLMTGLGVADVVVTVTPGGLVLGGFPAVLSGNPIGVTTDGFTIYVTDTVGDDVDMYTPAGVPLGSFPVASTFPEGITWNPATGTLFVVDPGGPAVLEYTVFGALLAAFPLLGGSVDGITVDPIGGGFWVYDSGTDLVRHYGPGFVELESFPGPIAAGYGPGEGVAVIGGTVYVASTTSGVVLAYDIADAMPPGATATFTLTGAGCTSPAIVQEVFPPGLFDLAFSSLLFTPNGTGGYVVAPGGPFVPPLAPPLPVGLDTVVPGLVLPFLFPHAGGVAATIDVCSLGYVWLGSDRRADFTPTAGEFGSQLARVAPLWMDLNPALAGTVHYDVGPASATVTWLAVAEFGLPGTANTFQLALLPGGAFELRWLAALNVTGAALVGYSAGPAAIGGAVDFSGLPVDTGAQTQPLGLARTARPVIGGAMLATVQRIPIGTSLGFMLYGFTPLPALPLAGAGLPGCFLYQTADVAVPFVVPGPSAVVALLVPPVPALAGTVVWSQAAPYSPPFTPLGLLLSNGGVSTLGF